MNDWRPRAGRAALRARAAMLAGIRAFFAGRGVLEVETPLLSAAATTDPALHSLATHWPGQGGPTRYLHTSPEYPMKRLLAAGSGDIWQLARVFRDGERGHLHHPEFTLLEWYRVGWDHRELMDEVAALVTALLAGHDLAPPHCLSYRDAFVAHAGIDPFLTEVDGLRRVAVAHGIEASSPGAGDDPRDYYLDLLLTALVEPHLGRGRLVFLHDYPASQAALARVRPGDPPLAERFELYWEGVELANGFHELGDAAEQQRRLAADAVRRAALGLPAMPRDDRFLAALAHGFPDCAGVALGVDRLLMLAIGAGSIDEVLAFPVERA